MFQGGLMGPVSTVCARGSEVTDRISFHGASLRSGKWGRCRLVVTLPPLGLTRNDTSMQNHVTCSLFVLLHEGKGPQRSPGEEVLKALDLLPGEKRVHTKILTLKAPHAPTPEHTTHPAARPQVLCDDQRNLQRGRKWAIREEH